MKELALACLALLVSTAAKAVPVGDPATLIILRQTRFPGKHHNPETAKP